MSMDAVVSFWQAVDKDPRLQSQLDPKGAGIPALLSSESFDRVSGVANKAGFTVTAAELRAAEAVKQFWMRVDQDQVLQQEILKADSLATEDALALIHSAAVKRGFDVTADQLLVVSRAQVQAAGARAKSEETGELSDQELENVAGGTLTSARYYYYYYYYRPASLGAKLLGSVVGG